MTNEEAQTLEYLIAHLADLEPGVKYAVAENFCRYCKSTDLVFFVKLEVVEGSLAGVQVKTSAVKWPWLRCRTCGHASKGKR